MTRLTPPSGRQLSVYLAGHLAARLDALRDRGVRVNVSAVVAAALGAELDRLERETPPGNQVPY